ncbi:metalloendopeptidase [Coemansia sp. RSA 1813]|nr:metalloendopeptidase [Coemansia sp. RSA 1646]KAJ1769333.1 metalloendopeptidase [Coemansia sp. RSA 1843]KAJ2089095.1 metalloendopeptidase [Coemansia sp. RSA 986]KAJ2215647.1 metalloendopeptidase [Coemansia sp. RSA 487]KAJ2568839.1 metalloendopeptidase [Coemansia sp. RSA 1813]
MEYWLTQPEVIRKISSHHVTGKPMPENLATKVCAMQNEFQTLHYAEQIVNSLFSLTINSSPEDKLDIEGIYKQISKEVELLDNGDVNVCPAANSDHYVDRYCSKYYGYLWAKVFAADLFKSRFLKDGIDNVQTGIEYRKTVLEPGASRNAMAMLETFLGRKPSTEAFIKMHNLA